MTEGRNPSFAYSTHQVRVVFGAGSLTQLAAELDREGLRHVLLLTTPGRARELDAVVAQLNPHLAGTYAGARPHVPAEAIQAARDVLERVEPDACLTLGGGSAIGLGKALAQKTGLPLVAIPTTYSGSEMTSIWGVTDGEVKRTGRDPAVAPRLVLYDPELTLSLPAESTAASGMNAIAHAVEAAYAPDADPVSSLLAWDAIRRLADSLTILVNSPYDRAARAEALTGAHLAGRALDMTSMGLQHKLAHVLAGSFGLPHAQAHAALLPCVVAFNATAAPEAMDRIAAALGTDDAVSGIAELAKVLKIKSLRELGFNAAMIPRAAALATQAAYANPRLVTEPVVRTLLESALAA
ncbi:MAG TPA: maleylacetate reductase [Gemmatimonadales bacterium]|jgi:maleylacetate reductase